MKGRLRILIPRLVLAGLLIPILIAGAMLLHNNATIQPLSRAQFVRTLDRAIASSRDWVIEVGEGSSVFKTQETRNLLQNGALLRMVSECAQASGDQRLRAVALSYFRVIGKPYWGRMIDPDSRFERVTDKDWQSLDDYQRWFLYALVPDEYPLEAEDRANMFSANKYRTGSATHQLLALCLYREHNGATKDLDWLIRHISERIAVEAAIDFRVTDLYLQRIAFLLAAGQPDLVKRRWVERAFAAQEADGGWLYSWHGWGPKLFRFRFGQRFTESHPTVQGMWIAYLLKYRYPQWIEANYP